MENEDSKDKEIEYCVYLFADLLEYGGNLTFEYSIPVLQDCWIKKIFSLIKHKNEQIRHMSVYSMSLLADKYESIFTNYLFITLEELNSLILAQDSRSESYLASTENAILTVGKILQRYPSQLSMESLLPAWLNYFPIQLSEDANSIYSLLCRFYGTFKNTLFANDFSNFVKMVEALVKGVTELLVDDDHARGEIIALFFQLKIEFPNELEKAMQCLPDKGVALLEILSDY